LSPRVGLADVPALLGEIRTGRRVALGRAITLVESSRPEDRSAAEALVASASSVPSQAFRLGMTGPPGVGKSTLIEMLGLTLCEAGHRVAVVAFDPSSVRTGGSILGDKTRMQGLARHPSAFIRPSPSRGMAGGVGRRTREAIVLCEAAGYDWVIVETVGVGQSETLVAQLVDFFMVLVMAGSGDSLQGIKRGILELADAVIVTKADGTNVERAERTRAEHARALTLMPRRLPQWAPPVLKCSAQSGAGVDALLETMATYRRQLEGAGVWASQRRDQLVAAMWTAIEHGIKDAIASDKEIAAKVASSETAVREGKLSPEAAARLVVQGILVR